jgi:hypothetical protein
MLASCRKIHRCSLERYGALTAGICSLAVLVLLPPSETKAPWGYGPPLALDGLSYPELMPVRRKLIDELAALAGDAPAGLVALGLSERQSGELDRNAALWAAQTLPALLRYTGVLYAALDAGSLRPAQRARLAVASALFGLLAADDPIPAGPAARRDPTGNVRRRGRGADRPAWLSAGQPHRRAHRGTSCPDLRSTAVSSVGVWFTAAGAQPGVALAKVRDGG